MSDCGCNNTRGPLLTEGKSKNILTEGFQYHIDQNIPLFESVYRIGSKKHLLLIKEARKLYSRDLINLCEEDINLVNTHIGEFALYKEQSVPLDLPMLNEDLILENKILDAIKGLGKETVDNLKAKITKIFNTGTEEFKEFGQAFRLIGKKKKGENLTPEEEKLIKDQTKDFFKMTFKGLGALSGIAAVAAGFPITATIATIIAIIGFLDLDDELLKYTDSSPETSRGLTKPEEDKTNFKDIGGVKYIKYDVVAPYLDQADAVAEALRIAGKEVEKIDKKGNDPENWTVIYKDGSKESYLKTLTREVLSEAKKKKKKKDPPLGKPKQGGPKAYYVYVRDPKSKRIKKVTFGSGGLRAKIKNKKARNAFAKRHDCKNKKDRTKASYWSCNLPRYASMLGLGANMNTFW